jgi:hypothetical protein
MGKLILPTIGAALMFLGVITILTQRIRLRSQRQRLERTLRRRQEGKSIRRDPVTLQRRIRRLQERIEEGELYIDCALLAFFLEVLAWTVFQI